ncbi:MAG: DUF5119 domain-containing protein [Parabacteroides gordonii]|uniref:DUF5119 domain-containing protein n=1 Tax=Parabacteroides gordonii TaxID=574930 RepID=UPI003A8814DB
MKTENRRIAEVVLAAWISGIVLLQTGCNRARLDDDWVRNGRVSLMPDWGTGVPPEEIACYFYPENGRQPVTLEGASSGYEGILPEGTYRLIVCSKGAKAIDLSVNAGYDSACAIVHPLGGTRSDSPLLDYPGDLYTTSLPAVEVSARTFSRVQFAPQSALQEVTLNIRLQGLAGITSVSGRLSGVASCLHLASGRTLYGQVGQVVFDALPAGNNLFTATFPVLGLSPSTEETEGTDNLLLVTVTEESGRELAKEVDITGVVDQAAGDEVLNATLTLDIEVAPMDMDGLKIEIVRWKTATGEGWME